MPSNAVLQTNCFKLENFLGLPSISPSSALYCQSRRFSPATSRLVLHRSPPVDTPPPPPAATVCFLPADIYRGYVSEHSRSVRRPSAVTDYRSAHGQCCPRYLTRAAHVYPHARRDTHVRVDWTMYILMGKLKPYAITRSCLACDDRPAFARSPMNFRRINGISSWRESLCTAGAQRRVVCRP